MRLKTALALPAALALTAGVLAHVPLVHPSNGKVLHWSSPSNVGIVINSAGSDDIADGSHETAMRLAIEEWNAATGTNATLVENTSTLEQARTDWTSSSIHLVIFDETNSSGYFPAWSGTVAITPIWFFSNGTISDADILFNGSGFQFTTSGDPGHFDVGDVGTHELGHLLGLDHTAWAGGTMYPFVDPTVSLHRSISRDEISGLRDAYPSASFGEITGSVRRLSDNSVVRGAHVVARDASGRTAASILSTNSGAFTIRGLDAGTYDVYVAPLGNGLSGGSDAPVDASNLTSWFTIETDFEAEDYPTSFTITGTETVAAGTLLVDADVSLNLGTESDRYPMRIIEGMSQTVVIRGSGLNPTSTLTVSDPDLIIGTPMWFGSQVSFQVTVPVGEAAGHVDVIATNAFGEQSILTAGLEITPPTPSVSSVSPTMGATAGGTSLTITGTGFKPGARIVVGDQIYTDGVAGTVVASPTTITLTTNSMLEGTHDVVVIDATGIEGRLVGAYQALAMPMIATVFPAAGVQSGATDVILNGADFLPGATVSIDGVDQGAVTWMGASRLAFTTTPGATGAQVLEVVNPGGALASSVFTYVAQPDPVVLGVTPSTVARSGGELVTVTGTGFTPTSLLFFDADPDTGVGGIQAESVMYIDANTMQAYTPQFSSTGDTNVLVADMITSQASLREDAVTVSGGGGGGGGGGCYMVPVDGPPRASGIARGAWWMLAVLALCLLRAKRVPARDAIA